VPRGCGEEQGAFAERDRAVQRYAETRAAVVEPRTAIRRKRDPPGARLHGTKGRRDPALVVVGRFCPRSLRFADEGSDHEPGGAPPLDRRIFGGEARLAARHARVAGAFEHDANAPLAAFDRRDRRRDRRSGRARLEILGGEASALRRFGAR
jgi:hypothetical protein